MTRVHVLTRGTDSPNTVAFLFPLHRHRQDLRAAGFKLRLFSRPTEELTGCDVLMVDGRLLADPGVLPGPGDLADHLDRWRHRAGRLLWIDTTASTGTVRAEILPHVDRYLKGQVLRDRDRYGEEHYGGRVFTDHVHHRFGVEDGDPLVTAPIEAPERSKIGVFWSSALADYGQLRPLLMALHRATGSPRFLHPPVRWTPPSTDRPVEVSARFGASYDRATVAFQRVRMKEMLDGRVETGRVGRWAYIRELQQSKVAISPFGWGEKCYRDYETLLAGALLVKPDVSHMETWPDLYRDDTMVALDWSLKDLHDVLDRVLDDYGDHVERARRGQELYRRHLVGPDAGERFVERFREVVRGRT